MCKLITKYYDENNKIVFVKVFSVLLVFFITSGGFPGRRRRHHFGSTKNEYNFFNFVKNAAQAAI